MTIHQHFRKVILLVVATLIFCTVQNAIAQRNAEQRTIIEPTPGVHIQIGGGSAEQRAAISNAKRDAGNNFDQRLWFLTGCLFNVGGYVFANNYYRPIPTIQLIGKSPEYIAYYTDTYRVELKKLRTATAFTGCLVGIAGPSCLAILWGVIQ